MQQNAPPHTVVCQAAPATPAGPGDPMPEAYCDAVLAEPMARSAPGIQVRILRHSEIPRHVLRRLPAMRFILEIQANDAQKLYGRHAVWKDVGRRLLDDSCQQRTGSHDDNGCWPIYDTP